MTIYTFRLGGLQTNTYFAVDTNLKKAIIIDPADDSVFIAEKIREFKVDPVAIIATHGHFDHNLAAGELQLILSIPYYIHEDDLFLLKNMNQSANHWLNIKQTKILPQNIQFLNNKTLSALGLNLKLIHTPGHTPGSVCLQAKKILFSGDTLFKQGIGRYDFSYSSKSQLFASLAVIKKLPRDTIVYPGHGESTTIGEESP